MRHSLLSVSLVFLLAGCRAAGEVTPAATGGANRSTSAISAVAGDRRLPDVCAASRPREDGSCPKGMKRQQQALAVFCIPTDCADIDPLDPSSSSGSLTETDRK